MSFTRKEVEAAVREFLPESISPKLTLSGDLNEVELITQTMGLVSNVILRDPDGVFRLRYIASEKLYSAFKSALSSVNELLDKKRGIRSLTTNAVADLPTITQIAAATTALASIQAQVADSVVGGEASASFTTAMESLLTSLAPIAQVSDTASTVDRLLPTLTSLKIVAAETQTRLTQFGIMETEIRAEELRVKVIAAVGAKVSDLLDDFSQDLTQLTPQEFRQKSREHMLRLTAALVAVEEAFTNTSATVPVFIDSAGLPTLTSLDAREWGKGEAAKTLSEVPAVLEGTTGTVPKNTPIAGTHQTTGFTTDTESDFSTGVTTISGDYVGYGPFELQLQTNVVLSGLPGSFSGTVSSPSTTFTHDGAGNITGASVAYGTINYVTGVVVITFSVSLASATITCVYDRKANLRTNHFHDTVNGDFVTDGVVAGNKLRLMVGGGAHVTDGYDVYYDVFSVVNGTELTVGRLGQGTRLLEGGIPEPYDAIEYEILTSIQTDVFKTDTSEPLWSMDNPVTSTYHVGGTRVTPELLSMDGPGFLNMLPDPTAALFFVSTGGWFPDITSGTDFQDPDGFIAAYFQENNGLGINITLPVALGGLYRVASVGADSNSLVLLDPISTLGYGTTYNQTFASVGSALVHDYALQLSQRLIKPTTVSIITSSSARSFTDDGAGALFEGLNAAGSIDYLSGLILLDTSLGGFLSPGEHIFFAGEHRAVAYTLVAISRYMAGAADTDVIQTANVLQLTSPGSFDLQAKYASNPAIYPGPGDFVFKLYFRPFWFRISRFIDADTIELQPVTYDELNNFDGTQTSVPKYIEKYCIETATSAFGGGVNEITYFMKAVLEGSTQEDVHNKHLTTVATAVDYQTLPWHNRTQIFRTSTAIFDPFFTTLHGWERLVLYPGTGNEVRYQIEEVIDTHTIKIRGYLSLAIGTLAANEFALEDITRPGHYLQVPLSSDWTRFIKIAEVVDETTLRLAEHIPDTIAARTPGELEYRIVSSIDSTRIVELKEDLSLAFNARGPGYADPHAIQAEIVPGPEDPYQAGAVLSDYYLELNVEDTFRTFPIQGIRGTGSNRQVIVRDAELPPWKRGLKWRIFRGQAAGTQLVRRLDSTFATEPLPADRICIWPTSQQKVPPEEGVETIPYEAVVSGVLPTNTVATASLNRVVGLDKRVPRFLEAYFKVFRSDALYAGRDALLTEFLSPLVLPTAQTWQDLTQKLHEIKLQALADETVQGTYATIPEMQLDAEGKLYGLKTPTAVDSWLALSPAVSVGQLVKVLFTDSSYSDITLTTYVKTVTARLVTFEPELTIPESSISGFTSQYTADQPVSFFKNDATEVIVLLENMKTTFQTAVDALTIYRADEFGGDQSTTAGLLRLLSEAGMSRAQKLLEDGELKKFFAVDVNNASLHSDAIEQARTVLSSLME
jgi:hypothetical protein